MNINRHDFRKKENLTFSFCEKEANLTKKYEKILTSVFTLLRKVSPLAVQKFYFVLVGVILNITLMPKINDYLQISQISQCAVNNSKFDSELMKLFFRKFRNFLTPGSQLRKSQIW